LKRRHIYFTLIISLVLVLSLLGAAGCPTTDRYNLTTNVSPTGGGSVSPSGGAYDAGVTVTITATANSGYVFDYWSGSASGNSPTTTVVMDAHKSVTAHFAAAGPAVLFSDNFSQDTGDWDIFSASEGDAFYEGGWLHVMNYTTATIDTYTMLDRYFSDFVLEVDTKLVDGTDDNWHGVVCRYQDTGNYYALGISADGYYYIAKFVDGDQIALASITSSSYINQGWDVVNSIRIECIGNSLSLAVNGHTLASVTDSTFSGGEIGLLATALAGSLSEVAYDNLVITEP